MGKRANRGRVRDLVALAICLGLSGPIGCSPSEDAATTQVAREAAPIGNAEGAVCGMVVGEQPAPRAQVIHRDGTRVFLCGIADLLVHLDARSPHGAAVEIFVEVMEADEDPRELHYGEHAWVPAADAVFRVGDERPRLIMGVPVMTYRDRITATNAISHGPTRLYDFEQLQAWWRESNRAQGAD